MKIVGIMCVRDEADLLTQVYPHVRANVDFIYAYDDGSQDDTWEYVKDSDYAIRRVDDKHRLEIHRPNYHHLLEKIKQDFKDEDVWAVICMGDRFFLNSLPEAIVSEAGEYEAVNGVQLDFLRHRFDPWTEENDPWPDMSEIRRIATWCKFDEQCIVAFKVSPETSYQRSKYPWPRGIKSVQYNYADSGNKLCVDMPFLEHQGRRSPKAAIWRKHSGSRPVSKKHGHLKFASFDEIMETQKKFYEQYKMLPWEGLETLHKLVEIYNEENWQNPVNRRYFFWGLEQALKLGWNPKRKDL
jgi:hypothetical protein